MIAHADVDEAIKEHIINTGRAPSYIVLSKPELRGLLEDMASMIAYVQLEPSKPVTLFGIPVFIKEEGVHL